MSYPFDPNDEPVPDYMADTGQMEPVMDPMADTGQNQAIRLEAQNRVPTWRRAFGLVSLLGAVGLTVATMLIVLSPDTTESPNNNPVNDNNMVALPTATPIPQENPQENVFNPPVTSGGAMPTLDPQTFSAILSTPIAPQIVDNGANIASVRNIYNPFTIIPQRARSEVETYTVVSGDTIFSIADRYGLQPETIAWANTRAIIGNLQPGQRINILPVDGVYYQVQTEETIAEVAARYHVDPYVIIDSEYNNLFGRSPDDPLPSGTWVVIPGAQAEQISWNPVVERVGADAATGAGGSISFAPGEQGSCGLVPNPGGGGGWIHPLDSYTWMRGFSQWHSGVDLSAPVGTPVHAANGGTVIFAGWNSFGYGYSIVLAHGPFTTLYGHLDAYYARCGQSIAAGNVIGAVGTSGNSTGPHLHFEIRYNDVPQDPTYTMAF
jgi:murein DD-endopeptidase MepM/ murein hydrolase activator NlpD